MSSRGLGNKDAANLDQPRPGWGHLALPSRGSISSSNNDDQGGRHIFAVSPAKGSRDAHTSNGNDDKDTTTTTTRDVSHAFYQERVPEKPRKLPISNEICEDALNKMSHAAPPFLGWRKRTLQNRNGMSTRGLGNNCAANLGQPRPERRHMATPISSSSSSSSSDHNVRQTSPVSPAEGSGYRDYQRSSTSGSGSPMLISTPGGTRGSFAPAIDMTGGNAGGTMSDIANRVNADDVRDIDDRPQHHFFEAFDENIYGEDESGYVVEEDLGASIGVGDTLGSGQVLTSEEGGLELLVDDSGVIVMKQTGDWVDAGEKLQDVTIDLFRSSFPGKPVRKLQGVFESLQRRMEGKSQRQRKILSCSSKEITAAGITCRRLRSKPRGKSEKSLSTSGVSLRVTNRGEVEISKGRKRVIIEPGSPAREKGWQRSFPGQALEVFRPESDDYELRVVETGFEVWLGTSRVWGFEAFPWEGST